MGRRTVIELLHLAAGLIVAFGLTYAFAWGYPYGRVVVWWCGAAAMIAALVMGIEPLRDAMAADRAARRGRA